MYQAEFVATNSEDWSQAIEFYDASGACGATGLIPVDADFELVVRDCGSPSLRASTQAGTILRNSPDVIFWRFPQAQMRALRSGSTYAVGLTMTTSSGTEQILAGTLSFLDGVVK